MLHTIVDGPDYVPLMCFRLVSPIYSAWLSHIKPKYEPVGDS